MDFYEETLNDIKESKHTIEDIAYIIIEGRNCKPEKFLEKIKGIKYHAGYGYQEINPSLEIVFKDGSFLARRESDGSEWWDFIDVKPLNVELEDFPDNAVIFDDNPIW